MAQKKTSAWAVIIGSGFGAAVTACRLAQAFVPQQSGLRICLLERGRRYAKGDFPRIKLPDYLTSDPELRTSRRVPDGSRLLWGIDQGLYDVRNLGQLEVVQAAGLGGGSLIYANVQLQPPDAVFESWPQPYRALDGHFARVTRWLGAAPLPEAWRDRIPKTRLMAEAAAKLGRTGLPQFFYPPLAIHFGPAQPNAFGREQGSCTGCGNCVSGCQEAAKNTLDLNYLAVAEDLGVEVRTLSEVVRIERAKLDPRATAAPGRVAEHEPAELPPDAGYEVVYYDHLERIEYSIQAKYVFVGAGAVGTTELLIRSAGRLRDPDSPLQQSEGDGLQCVGQSFFANGDNLGVVFDTRQAAAHRHGPTITTTLLCAEPNRPGAAGEPAPSEVGRARSGIDVQPVPKLVWFLVQDGGMPAGFDRVLGLFRSPLWLAKNRLTTSANGGRRRSLLAQAATLADQGIADVSNATANFLSLFTGAVRDEPTPPPAGLPSGWIDFLPEALQSRARWLANLSDEAREHTRRLDERVLEKLGPDTWFLSRVWVDRSKLLEHVGDAVSELYPMFRHLLRGHKGLELLTSLVTRLLMDEAPSAHTMVLLAMGPDQPGELTLKGRRLRMHWKEDANIALFGLQERFMRDLAAVLGGELRSNPNWTLGRRSITVHAQGGCRMGERSPARTLERHPEATNLPVTSPTGRVWGQAGLYVVDASAFPGSVGVNPSSTIAAVAEKKMELFLGPHRYAAAVETIKRLQVAPLSAASAAELPNGKLTLIETPAVRSQPVGLRWSERMQGFATPVAPDFLQAARSGDPDSAPLEPTDPSSASEFLAIERDGTRERVRTVLDLNISIPDIDLFTRSFRALRPEAKHLSASVAGTVSIGGTSYAVPGHASRVEFQLDTTEAQPRAHEPRQLARLYMSIDLYAENAPDAALKRLRGYKFFHDDPGHDVWIDLATLFFIVHDAASEAVESAGVARINLSDFLSKQLGTYDVTSSQGEFAPDESVRVWALLRFAGTLFGGIRNVYDRWY